MPVGFTLAAAVLVGGLFLAAGIGVGFWAYYNRHREKAADKMAAQIGRMQHARRSAAIGLAKVAHDLPGVGGRQPRVPAHARRSNSRAPLTNHWGVATDVTSGTGSRGVPAGETLGCHGQQPGEVASVSR